MPLVVDASVALAWALPDESSDYADAVLIAVEREGLRVPDLWAREIANGLAVAYLRKRIRRETRGSASRFQKRVLVDARERASRRVSPRHARVRTPHHSPGFAMNYTKLGFMADGDIGTISATVGRRDCR
jgi:hypothetical protein